jgi:hypothetical protein
MGSNVIYLGSRKFIYFLEWAAKLGGWFYFLGQLNSFKSNNFSNLTKHSNSNN